MYSSRVPFVFYSSFDQTFLYAVSLLSDAVIVYSNTVKYRLISRRLLYKPGLPHNHQIHVQGFVRDPVESHSESFQTVSSFL